MRDGLHDHVIAMSGAKTPSASLQEWRAHVSDRFRVYDQAFGSLPQEKALWKVGAAGASFIVGGVGADANAAGILTISLGMTLKHIGPTIRSWRIAV
jgi:hypothetical protein